MCQNNNGSVDATDNRPPLEQQRHDQEKFAEGSAPPSSTISKAAGGGFDTSVSCSPVSSGSILVLALVWISLCTALVCRKTAQLSVAAFVFLSSFILSQSLGYVFELYFVPSDGKTAPPPSILRYAARRLVPRFIIGLVFGALLPLWCLTGGNNHHVAVSLLVGALAYDLWQGTTTMPSYILSILESEASVRFTVSSRISSILYAGYVIDTAFVLILSVTVLSINASESCDEGETMLTLSSKQHFYLSLWLFIKIGRIVGNLTYVLWSLCVALSMSELRSISMSHTVNPVPNKIDKELRNNSAAVVTDENLWTIYGKSYDLRPFLDKHPGGREAMELGRGRDCTALFESYHPFTDRHRLVLKKYEPVREIKANSGSEIKPDKFYEELKRNVSAKLVEVGIDPIEHRGATISRKCYYFVVFVCVLITGRMHMNGSFVGSFLFALSGWLLGSLGHDGGHYSVSRIPLVNDIAVWGMYLIANPIMWQHQHTYAHHSHTNEFEHDPDLHHFSGLLRVHRKFKYNEQYAAQSNPAFILLAYAFVVFGTAVWIPLDMIVTGSLYDMVSLSEKKKRPVRYLTMILHLASYIYIIIVSPFFTSSSVLVGLLCVVTHVAFSGFFFAFFSQINHLNEQSIEFEDVKSDLKDTWGWAAKQVVTSNNFAAGSRFWHILSNGLNLQIEHHLFPGLNHGHLHLIAPTVRETCKKYRVPYKEYNTYGEIATAGLNWLDTLAKAEL